MERSIATWSQPCEPVSQALTGWINSLWVLLGIRTASRIWVPFQWYWFTVSLLLTVPGYCLANWDHQLEPFSQLQCLQYHEHTLAPILTSHLEQCPFPYQPISSKLNICLSAETATEHSYSGFIKVPSILLDQRIDVGCMAETSRLISWNWFTWIWTPVQVAQPQPWGHSSHKQSLVPPLAPQPPEILPPLRTKPGHQIHLYLPTFCNILILGRGVCRGLLKKKKHPITILTIFYQLLGDWFCLSKKSCLPFAIATYSTYPGL